MTIAVLGLNHKSSRLEFREMLQRNIENLHPLYPMVRSAIACDELLILTTCNRIELYFSSPDLSRTVMEIEKLLLGASSNDPVAVHEFQNSFYLFTDEDAARHCFAVAPGLDSMILGEPEILGQMKQAFQTAKTEGCLSGPLFRLLEKAFQTAKEIRTGTAIGKGAVGTASVSLELARNICGPLDSLRILILGTGKLGEKLIRHALKSGCKELIAATRRPEREEELAKDYGIRTVPFAEWATLLTQVDLFVSATTAPNLLLTAGELGKILPQRKGRPLCLIDLSVPRTVDPGASQLSGVHLFNIEDLKGIGYQSQAVREKAMAEAYAIIDRKAASFTSRTHSPDFSRLVTHLNDAVHECVHRETWLALEPYLKSEEERRAMEHAVHQLEGNLFHSFLARLKELVAEEGVENMGFLFHKLFRDEFVDFQMPVAFKKYSDALPEDLRKRFSDKLSSVTAR